MSWVQFYLSDCFGSFNAPYNSVCLMVRKILRLWPSFSLSQSPTFLCNGQHLPLPFGCKRFHLHSFCWKLHKKNLRNSKAARGETRYSEGPLYIELNIKSHLLSVIVSVNPDDQTALMWKPENGFVEHVLMFVPFKIVGECLLREYKCS